MRRTHRRIYQAVGGSSLTGEPGNLTAEALMDGANLVYQFSEAAGPVLNQDNPGTYDLIYIHAQVDREVESPEGPDMNAYQFPGNAQAWQSYGYARGFGAGSGRPSQAAYTRVAHEILLRVDGLGQSGKALVHGQAFGGAVDAYRLDIIADDHLRFHLPLSTPLINTNDTAALVDEWHHYVWQYDGTDFQVFIDGQLAYDETTGIGAATLYDVDPASCIMNFGGADEGSAKNSACSVAFFASYPDLSLSPERIAMHAHSAGV